MSRTAARGRLARPPALRARRVFWLLVVVAALSAGSLFGALSASAGPITGLRVAASGLVLLTSVTLATRVMLALERARQRAGAARTPTSGPQVNSIPGPATAARIADGSRIRGLLGTRR